VLKQDSELGNAHAHSLYDRLTVVANHAAAPARDFGAYGVAVDGSLVSLG